MTTDTIHSARISDSCNAVMVPFDAKWEQPLLEGAVQIVIRKRVPKNKHLKWLYVYGKSPVGRLLCRAEILELKDIPKDDAISKSASIGMPADAIDAYVGNKPGIGCFVLGAIEPVTKTVDRDCLMVQFGVHPPQGFYLLKANMQAAIDELACFSAK